VEVALIKRRRRRTARREQPPMAQGAVSGVLAGIARAVTERILTALGW
jgi:hypothetical protein